MSRAGVPRALVTLGVVASLLALVSLVSCVKEPADQPKVAADQAFQNFLAALAPDKDTVRINFKCATVDSIGLFDMTGKPAWNVIRHPNQTITWIVAQTVTINSIKGKSGPLPITVDQNQHGQAPGVSFIATVNNNAGTPGPGSKNYAYELDVTCTAGPKSTRLVIDPEMIINRP